jgi:hypothetical protein
MTNAPEKIWIDPTGFDDLDMYFAHASNTGQTTTDLPVSVFNPAIRSRYSSIGSSMDYLSVDVEYTRTDVAQAKVEGFQERISELVALLDQQLGTHCEIIRHAQEMQESQARISELEAFIKKAFEAHSNLDLDIEALKELK